MLTPAFELNQDSEFLTLMIRVPYTRTSDFDLYIDGEDFKFYAKPYFLRLTLPGRIVEDGREKASFDIDKGVFTLRVAKESPGQHFEGLQMLTSLLAPRGSRSAKSLVEEMEPCAASAGAMEEEEEEEEEFDWQVEQTVYTESSEVELKQLQKYGFGNLRSGVFSRLQEELSDVIDVKDPDSTTPAERRIGRQAAEHNKFDPDHYLADLFEDEAIQSLLRFRPWWREASLALSQHSLAPIEFSDEDKEQMRKFTNRSYLLSKTSRYHAWLSLVDVILAYAYEIRITEGEHNVESPWNIRKLSGTLCWLETYHSLQDVLVSFGRRVVSYPLHRHFSLVASAVRDVARIFQAGKVCLLKCLLDIHKIFRENDPAYILNDLYITDYCVWIQKVKSKHVTTLAEALQKATLRKSDLGLELEELERAAALVEREQQEEEDEEDGSSSGDESDSSDSSSSSSSSSSSEDSDDCQTGDQGTVCVVVNSGGIAANNNNDNNNPLQPQPPPGESPALTPAPAPAPAPSFSPHGGTDSGSPVQLIQELGDRLEEGLRISLTQPEGTPSASGSSSSRNEPERAGERRGKGERGKESERAHTRSSSVEQRQALPAVAPEAQRTLLEACPRRNPLLIVRAEASDSD